MATIKENLARIQDRIVRAARKAGRDPDSIRLVAVSKRMAIDRIREAIDAGQRLFGENFIQEAQEKINLLPQDISWHFIGHLQSNKAKTAARLFNVIETVDRAKVAGLLARHAAADNRKIGVLIQVNIGREAQKAGVMPEDVEPLLHEITQYTSLVVKGLMTIPPFFPDQEQVRPYFRKMRQLAEELQRKGFFSGQQQVELSMGMSGDFEAAIEEGATLIRVGTAVFGERRY